MSTDPGTRAEGQHYLREVTNLPERPPFHRAPPSPSPAAMMHSSSTSSNDDKDVEVGLLLCLCLPVGGA